MEGYNTELKLRIDWSEMDLFGHVNNVSFFKYIQASRVNYWEKIGLTQLHNDAKKGPMLASANCKFRQPLVYPGDVIIKSRVGMVKTTSFSIEHVLLNDKGEIVAEAEDIVVFFDFIKNEKEPIPLFLRDKIKLVEQKEF